jgi:DNA-binding FadR family transcriptional regulator
VFAAREFVELACLHGLQKLRRRARATYLEPFLQRIEEANASGDTNAAVDADFHRALVARTENARRMRSYEGLRKELRLVLVLAERRRDRLGPTGTEANRVRNDDRTLLRALQGSEAVGAAALREHLAEGAAQLHRLRQLLRDSSG